MVVLPGNIRTKLLALDAAQNALARSSIFDRAIIFWRGTSGHEYVHTVYSLTGCPAIQPAVILLVRNQDNGRRSVLRVMSVEKGVPSLNLAEIRQAGAAAGANEVHVHFASGHFHARLSAMIDLQMQHGAANPVGL